MPAAFSKLTKFPRHRLLEDELIRGRASELDLLALFGESTTQSPADDPDPSFYWDVEWSCELVMGLQFKQLTEVLSIRLDLPDTEHALRHLGFDLQDVWLLEREAPLRFAEITTALPHASEIWLEHRDGLIEPVQTGLTERDAACQVIDLNADGGLAYWVMQNG